jgi:ubiquinone/menaquinone biosynthesis C-methylase UbiE
MSILNTEQGYNEWASSYDDDRNLTRDLEGKAIREVLKDISYDTCLEIGCGTGKNTVWLVQNAREMVSVDLSVEMLAKAKSKITDEKIHFVHADINEEWTFTDRTYDLVTFSLILEHIENIDAVFEKTARILKPGGHMYIGELHPYKQYSGSKARFESKEGVKTLPCFNHHISDFTDAGRKYNLSLVDLEEYFDEEDGKGMPRIVCLLFKKEPDKDAK